MRFRHRERRARFAVAGRRAHLGAAVTLIRDQDGPFNDKESMIADPTDARYAYAIWDRLDGNLGPTVFTRTTDSGATWEPPT